MIADIIKLIARYEAKHRLAGEAGSEYIMQSDEAQEDAIQLVCDIFDRICKESEGKDND